MQQQFINLRRGTPGLLQPPLDSTDGLWTPMERAGLEHTMMYAVTGSPSTVKVGIAAFIERTSVDELMIAGQIYDHADRLRSFEIAAQPMHES